MMMMGSVVIVVTATVVYEKKEIDTLICFTYTQVCYYEIHLLAAYTVDGERFAGPNVRIFNPTEVFAEILSRCLGQKCLLFSMIKERHLYSQENFHGTLENREKHECLAQRIFPRLRYIIGH